MGLPTAWTLRRLCRQMQSCSRLGICTNRIQQATSNHRRPPPAWAFAICSGGCEAVHNLGGCTAEEFQLAFQATGTRQHSMGICDVLYRQKRSFSRPGQLYRSGVAAGDFRPHELANTAWAFATFDQADAKPFVSVALARSEVAFRRLQSTGACQHSMGIATFVQSNAKLFATLACAHRSLSLGDFKPLELANAAWAWRRVIRRMRSCSQSRQLAQQRVSIGNFKPQELANTAWAFATFVQADAKLFATWAVAQHRSCNYATSGHRRSPNTSLAFVTLVQADAKQFAILALATSSHRFSPTQHGHLRRLVRRCEAVRGMALAQRKRVQSSLQVAGARQHSMGICHVVQADAKLFSTLAVAQKRSCSKQLQATGDRQHSRGICGVWAGGC